MEFVFVRHGESVNNAAGLFAGSLDVPLTEQGLTQARRAALDLAHEQLDWVVSSPLSRALTTAHCVAAPHGLEVMVDHRLAEHCKGVLEGTEFRKVRSCEWRDVEGAESMRELYERTLDALYDLAQLPGRGAVVAHAGVARAVECIRLGSDPDELFDLAKVGNAQPYSVSLTLPVQH